MKPPRYMRSLPQLLRSRSAEFWPVLRSLAAEELERLAGDNCRLRKKLQGMLHLMLTDRIGQGRGVSVLASVITRLEDLKDYEESERVAAKIAANRRKK